MVKYVVMRSQNHDVRVAVIGDSFVQGVRDPQRLGWVGRLPLCAEGVDLTVYNLGIRRDTSEDVARRWVREVEVRLKDGHAYGACFSFGVNDTTAEGQSTRVPHDRSVAALTGIARSAANLGWSKLVVGPPPVADEVQNERIAQLDDAYSKVGEREGFTYVSIFRDLLANPVWMKQVAEEDGSHPSSAGYRSFSELVGREWSEWVLQLSQARRY